LTRGENLGELGRRLFRQQLRGRFVCLIHIARRVLGLLVSPLSSLRVRSVLERLADDHQKEKPGSFAGLLLSCERLLGFVARCGSELFRFGHWSDRASG